MLNIMQIKELFSKRKEFFYSYLEIDLKNVEKLKKFSDTLTVMSFKMLEEAVLRRKKCLKKSYS